MNIRIKRLLVIGFGAWVLTNLVGVVPWLIPGPDWVVVSAQSVELLPLSNDIGNAYEVNGNVLAIEEHVFNRAYYQLAVSNVIVGTTLGVVSWVLVGREEQNANELDGTEEEVG